MSFKLSYHLNSKNLYINKNFVKLFDKENK